ncbi:hypothetical protein VCUG_01680 [Vavraia culicis subsp. floridensis]|uniref:Uncharacterized protein n=1 Tax=Vavraia culicis (isolate floridensis) TaxID=948595 RepID=L2GT43_VAVCU|nr:uncharacterized protein VCUG_01680 [Vavraia culicis subsp. floridensis]ELA46836.1 hypothetical protein VCUG_01680 [Vavraia culicis subsp. floridensis]
MFTNGTIGNETFIAGSGTTAPTNDYSIGTSILSLASRGNETFVDTLTAHVLPLFGIVLGVLLCLFCTYKSCNTGSRRREEQISHNYDDANEDITVKPQSVSDTGNI